jgi:hypothetical protein
MTGLGDELPSKSCGKNAVTNTGDIRPGVVDASAQERSLLVNSWAILPQQVRSSILTVVNESFSSIK